MRVVMLSWEYPPRIVGGISPHVFELSQQLQAKGIEVHVVTKATPRAPDEEVQPSGVRVHRVHLDQEPNDFIHEIQLLNVATDLKVRSLLEEWRPAGEPTLLHAHDWLSLDAARELKYMYKLPMVATVHATEEGRNGGIHTEMQRYIHEQEYWLTYEAWSLIVCSQFMREELVRQFDVPEDKAHVIFNGVDASRFEFEWPEAHRQERRRQFAEPGDPIVLFVGRFVREKGLHVLLNAAHAVLAEYPGAKFLLVGGGKRDRLERFVRWSGLQGRVAFTGFQSGRSLLELYRIADVAAFPSLYEPFGIVALEAMAAGVPVVTSDSGGLKEVVLHDETGTLSFSGDARSLAWALRRVLDEPERAKRLAANAKRRLSTDFSWSLIAGQTVELYERVWAQFLQSYWADETLWPVSPGAEQRAEAKLRELRSPEPWVAGRPRPQVSQPELPTTIHVEEPLPEEEPGLRS